MNKKTNAAILSRNELTGKAFIYVVTITMALFFSGCSKEGIKSQDESANIQSAEMSSGVPLVNNVEKLSIKTRLELQMARAATAKYQNINNALAEGYQDIHVDVQNMGHHYMKMSLVDDVFDFTKPELLVYNKDKNGVQRLVAIEYAVPLAFARPEGFTGAHDVWDENKGFDLWLLHAWVWHPNPLGVFNPTNPEVHLH